MAIQKILIVDDSKTIRTQIKEMLPKGNFEVLEAGDGVAGFDSICQHRPNLVLLDFFMPRMNGWEVVLKIQTFPKLQSIPIVMMSGRREDVEKAVPELFEYFEFLNKPFDQQLLLSAIKSATEKAKYRYQILKQAHLTSKVEADKSEADSNKSHTVVTAAALDDHHYDTSNGNALKTASLGEVALPVDNETVDVKQLQQAIQVLQQENAKLKDEFNRLKQQVAHILVFIRKNQD
jgi:two-component system response regulator